MTYLTSLRYLRAALHLTAGAVAWWSAVATNGALAAEGTDLCVRWQDNILTIQGGPVGDRVVQVLYIEAYCRPDSHTTDWVAHTVIPHRSRLVASDRQHKRLHIRSILEDGVVVDHEVTAGQDEVDFRITARNPTDRPSHVAWAQPCIRVGSFTGLGPDRTEDAYAYIRKCFIFLDGQLARMPTRDWATQARYTPGQVWAAPGVSPEDVNPRPRNPHTPSNGLIGCFSEDEQRILAVAFQPYQELFQGVIRCIHSDFRIDGLAAGQTKRIRGKIYIVPNDVPALVERYRHDFPEHCSARPSESRDAAPEYGG